jgi:hypothetical protein
VSFSARGTRSLVTAVRLAVLVAILLVVQGCGSSGDSSEPAQLSIPSVTAPAAPQQDARTTTTSTGVAAQPSPKPGRTDDPESGSKAANDQDTAKRGGSGSGRGKSNAAEDAQRAEGGAPSGTPGSTAQAESTAKADEQRAGG